MGFIYRPLSIKMAVSLNVSFSNRTFFRFAAMGRRRFGAILSYREFMIAERIQYRSRKNTLSFGQNRKRTELIVGGKLCNIMFVLYMVQPASENRPRLSYLFVLQEGDLLVTKYKKKAVV